MYIYYLGVRTLHSVRTPISLGLKQSKYEKIKSCLWLNTVLLYFLSYKNSYVKYNLTLKDQCTYVTWGYVHYVVYVPPSP